MRLAALHQQLWRPRTPLDVLTALLGLYAPQLQLSLAEAASGEVVWPASWAADLFVPPRNFEARKRARRFLKWLIANGVAAQPWLDHLEEPHAYPAVPPPQPWEGYVGRAYPIGDRIVKFTTDKNEAGLAAAIAGEQSPHLATIYNVATVGGGRTNSGSTKDLYAIIQERINTGVSKVFRMAGTAVYDYLDRFRTPIDDVDRTTDIICRDFAPKRPDQKLRWAIRSLLAAIKDIYDRFGIMYLDPHGANIGLKGRNVAFFDLGRSAGSRHGHSQTLW